MWRASRMFFITLCVVALWIGIESVVRTDARVRISFLDVGQGDAILIQTPNKRQMLIDSGGDAGVLRMLGKTMPLFDRSIDVLMVTHPDLDHIGGVPAVLDRYHVGVLLMPDVATTHGAFNAVEEYIHEHNTPRYYPIVGTEIALSPEVVIEILFPDRAMQGAESNSASIIALLHFKEHRILLMGDAPARIERYMVSTYGALLDSDVLKVGHHGSKTSSDETFIKTVSPQYAVISSGKENRYGHPHEIVLKRLEKNGTTVLRTDRDGVIHILSDGKALAVVK